MAAESATMHWRRSWRSSATTALEPLRDVGLDVRDLEGGRVVPTLRKPGAGCTLARSRRATVSVTTRSFSRGSPFAGARSRRAAAAARQTGEQKIRGAEPARSAPRAHARSAGRGPRDRPRRIRYRVYFSLVVSPAKL